MLGGQGGGVRVSRGISSKNRVPWISSVPINSWAVDGPVTSRLHEIKIEELQTHSFIGHAHNPGGNRGEFFAP